jgi:hypothetical protein
MLLILSKYNHRGHREDINIQGAKKLVIPSPSVSSNLLPLLLLLQSISQKRSTTPFLY